MKRWRYAIVGSRDYEHRERVRELMVAINNSKKPILVSGGAGGVDTWAEEIADELGWGKDIYFPDYTRYNPGHAPLERNTEIAANCDKMFAFWNGKSRGTLDAIKKAVLAGKPVEIIPDC